MTDLKITVGELVLSARLESELAPKTCEAFLKALPFHDRIIHVRWSGEGVWMPLGNTDFGVDYENATRHPAPGQIILYPGGASETEILLAYGAVSFASKAGPLAGNHFLTITSNLDMLYSLGRDVLYGGAKDIVFSLDA